MILRLLLLAASCFVAATAEAAQDYIETDGLLSDDDFYRLVACAAPPGGDCTKRFLRWSSDEPLHVQIAGVDRAFLGGKQKRARAALTRAVQYINAVDSALRVEQVPQGSPADIRIHFVDTDGKAPLQNTGIEGADGTIVTGARVIVWSDRATGTIKRATILFGTRLHIRDYESAMLEELTQALGLLTDIRNPAYNDVSIFSQDSNASKQFGPQDRMVLRRHYPKE